MKVRYSPIALRELDEISAHIGQHNPQAARQLLTHLKSSIERLGRHPLMGRATDDETGARVFPIPRTSYKVFYDVEAEGVVVLRVMHGAMDK